MRNAFNGLAALIIIVFLVGIIPCVDGLMYKREYLKTISHLNANTGYDYKILEYRTGWLKSYAKLSIKPKHIEKMNSDFVSKMEIVIDQEITHGPLVQDPMSQRWTLGYAVMHSRIHIEPLETMLGIPKDQGVGQIDALVTFGGDYIAQSASPAFSGEVADFGKFSWKGYQGNTALHFSQGNLESIKSSGSSPGVQFQHGANVLAIENITGQSDFKTIPPYQLWDGNYNTRTDKIVFTISGKSIAEIQAFNVIVSSNLEQNQFYNATLNIGFDKINIPDVITVSPMTIKVVISHIDAAALSDFMRAYAEGSVSPQKADFAHLITPTSSLTGDVDMNTSMGHFLLMFKAPNDDAAAVKPSARVFVRVAIPLVNYLVDKMDKPHPTVGATTSMSDPESLQPATQQPTSSITQPVTIQAGVSPQPVSPPTARDQINQWVKIGYIIQDQNDYVIDIVENKGMIKINGKDFMMMPPLSQPPA